MAHLAAREYQLIEMLSGGARLSAKQLEIAVREYGRTIVSMPDDAVSLINYIAIRNSNPPTWSVRAPVFTFEEGCSDLTLELTLTESESGQIRVQCDGLHVL